MHQPLLLWSIPSGHFASAGAGVVVDEALEVPKKSTRICVTQ